MKVNGSPLNSGERSFSGVNQNSDAHAASATNSGDFAQTPSPQFRNSLTGASHNSASSLELSFQCEGEHAKLSRSSPALRSGGENNILSDTQQQKSGSLPSLNLLSRDEAKPLLLTSKSSAANHDEELNSNLRLQLCSISNLGDTGCDPAASACAANNSLDDVDGRDDPHIGHRYQFERDAPHNNGMQQGAYGQSQHGAYGQQGAYAYSNRFPPRNTGLPRNPPYQTYQGSSNPPQHRPNQYSQSQYRTNQYPQGPQQYQHRAPNQYHQGPQQYQHRPNYQRLLSDEQQCKTLEAGSRRPNLGLSETVDPETFVTRLREAATTNGHSDLNFMIIEREDGIKELVVGQGDDTIKNLSVSQLMKKIKNENILAAEEMVFKEAAAAISLLEPVPQGSAAAQSSQGIDPPRNTNNPKEFVAELIQALDGKMVCCDSSKGKDYSIDVFGGNGYFRSYGVSGLHNQRFFSVSEAKDKILQDYVDAILAQKVSKTSSDEVELVVEQFIEGRGLEFDKDRGVIKLRNMQNGLPLRDLLHGKATMADFAKELTQWLGSFRKTY